ncbi:hypothetical protein PHYBLDRAFT_72834 [Phycomyces blakesleeanus NRRL 1555(-)]|uniref:Uncharacterized protein n=1 Tax=Phycomyces blakesleeanus (strain ATCC 8743b / DSM 1359 / FGSC 10004 / NBRC 33097 / NRRL 1555) TaxID=763407 RepID=A0A162UJG3_PHYB8|nr:hypothetical protein PHYBLDRAFT_72834 [Phycomyces blakesleeanus NRRL 1555(-)]OAD75723.1 hypothetical protein PHYBLDRAFT_72834 [Phycomyces blakesleeanus NRRL 1555(-)]|eukprot:XP_018293763.1 hypothetical protein PHYBLDRAFT_72834 [Phycomyces blakesleeanus NRRL 1555(-)]
MCQLTHVVLVFVNYKEFCNVTAPPDSQNCLPQNHFYYPVLQYKWRDGRVGLRRHVKAVISSEAWVRIPLSSFCVVPKFVVPDLGWSSFYYNKVKRSNPLGIKEYT